MNFDIVRIYYQPSVTCGNKLDMSRISASVAQIFPGIASFGSVKMQIAAAHTQALLRARVFLLRLKA